MPTSFMQNIPDVVELMQKLKPKRILDIGIGNGKYGLLAHEYIDGVEVDGVEAYEPYITDIQRAIYHNIFIGDVTKMDAKKLKGYDLYLMIDVIEHVPKSVGHRILQQLDGLVLESTPVEDYRAHYENHFEDHVSHWTPDDFKNYSYTDYSNEYSTMVLVDTSKSAAESELATLRKEHREVIARLGDVESSLSWKVTAPLRWAKHKVVRK